MLDENASLLQKTSNDDYSNFTHLNSWSNHYKSWKDTKDFKTLFIKFEDLEKNKFNTFLRIVNFIDELKASNHKVNQKKMVNAINSTSFSNLKNKEQIEGFSESVYSSSGQKKKFFNLGFNNRWQKILPKDILDKINNTLQNELNDLGYNINE